MRKTLMDCPEQDCVAGPADQQQLPPKQYAEIPAEDRHRIESRTLNGIIDVSIMLCARRKSVYGRWPTRNHIFGRFEDQKWSVSKNL